VFVEKPIPVRAEVGESEEGGIYRIAQRKKQEEM